MSRALHNRVTYGKAILSRFRRLVVPAAIKGDLVAFKLQHAVFVTASAVVDTAEAAYDGAAKRVAKLDAVRDKTLLTIADKLPAAGLGTRASPFARFSKYGPTKLATLPYAAQTVEMASLLTGISKAKPPAEIAKLCTTASAENDAVETALAELDAPLAALDEARSQRDAAIPDWEKQLRRLQDAAKVAFRDVPGRSAALFAEPDAIETRVTPKKRTKAAPVIAPPGQTPGSQPPAAPGDPAIVATAAKTRAKRKRKRRR